jgi:hypothetical protein
MFVFSGSVHLYMHWSGVFFNNKFLKLGLIVNCSLRSKQVFMEFVNYHPCQPGVLRRFETALLTPGPIQGISSRGGCSRALPPAKYYQ